jgi:ADP-ribose pyrophosphatase YjhB (NUDIX family)
MTQPEIIFLEAATTLNVMRFNAVSSHKAAILPFHFVDGDPRYVVYAPVPQHEGEHGKLLPYQIARGTMQAEYQLDGKVTWHDKGRGRAPERAQWVRDESPAEAALREAQEELGLPREGISTLYDCGKLPYQNPRGVVYSLHMFLARIPSPEALAFPDPYACAARLNAMTLSQARTLATIPEAETTFEMRPFKPSYLTLLEVLHETVMGYCYAH